MVSKDSKKHRKLNEVEMTGISLRGIGRWKKTNYDNHKTS